MLRIDGPRVDKVIQVMIFPLSSGLFDCLTITEDVLLYGS